MLERKIVLPEINPRKKILQNSLGRDENSPGQRLNRFRQLQVSESLVAIFCTNDLALSKLCFHKSHDTFPKWNVLVQNHRKQEKIIGCSELVTIGLLFHLSRFIVRTFFLAHKQSSISGDHLGIGNGFQNMSSCCF